MFKATDEQKQEMVKISLNMKKRGATPKFLAKAYRFGQTFEGVYDLFCIWNDEDNEQEQANTMTCLQEVIIECERSVLLVSDEDWDKMMEEIENPSAPNEELKELMKEA